MPLVFHLYKKYCLLFKEFDIQNVAEFDFVSLYRNIMLKKNLSQKHFILLLYFLNHKICIQGVRVSPETEEKGLDIEEHAERAYSDEGDFDKI